MTTTNCAGGYLLQTSECTPPSVSSSPWPQHWPSPSGPSLPRERVVCWESGVDFDHPAARLRVTTMSCSLPPEILDAIIDQLYDEPTSLKACCLVSKSWIPRTQKHLFVHIEFDPPKHSFGSWMRMSPDPSNSPAHRAHSLTILYLPTITFTGTDLCGWTSTFDNVTHLHFERCIWTSHSADLTPFFGFSPALRSLRMTYTSFEVFDLICSFPLLEDLALVDLRPEDGTVWRRAPSISPKLTGSLDLDTTRELHSVTRRLWDFPNGLHFAKIAMSFGIGQDFLLATDLVSRCSSTLESLNIRSSLKITSRGLLPDLSKAAKLKDLMFMSRGSNIHWIVSALKTLESKGLQQLTIHLYTPSKTEETDNRDWQYLDRLLVQFWTSHSIRPRLVYMPNIGGWNMRSRVPNLLPGLTERELIDLVEYSPPS